MRRGAIRPRSPSEMLEPSRPPGPPRGAVAPNAPRRGSGFMRFLSGLFTVVLVVMLAAGSVMALLYHQFETSGPLAVSRVVTVPRGEGRIEIATRLEREGAISNRWAFIINYMLRSALGPKPLELKAGDYEIKKNASMAEIMETLTQGRGVLSKITIPEGLTSLQIVEKLRGEDELVGDITEIPAEGTLLPDTYRYSKGMERRELLERMQGEMQRFLAAAWERRQPSLPITTPEQAIIFASIVEKETGRADERGRVAAVFMNRLKKGMRLQSDPTVIYGIVGGQGTLGRSITRADLDQKSSHNTYQIGGLPPTPICNPGRPAIEASLNPPMTTDLYFVADGTGGHTFSDTLKEHNAAVNVWRKVERDRKKDQPADAADTPDAVPVPLATQAAAPRVLNAKGTAPAVGSGASVPLPVRKPKQ
ncbi:endolytic transglycosylase MltG [Hyphomicrobium sp. xq]|uniref:Endolytic murein transglycosylase n=1 Tax=Hyphomicrobium album TaxID=2665159 RepID=A0A6I3KHB3_9HYPH|nr:endolytic transglycosylase MltG [Hyphomicrobium album]MTD93077.1 endolytic transglycosylase MltG [Hyphomicrobium album]